MKNDKGKRQADESAVIIDLHRGVVQFTTVQKMKLGGKGINLNALYDLAAVSVLLSYSPRLINRIWADGEFKSRVFTSGVEIMRWVSNYTISDEKLKELGWDGVSGI